MTKKLLFVFTLVALHFSTNLVAQVPAKAEDISPLLIGERIPEALIVGADGNELKLQSILKEKPTVLVFYRGGWCPYCNNQLSELADIESEIVALGYQIVAISPDDYKNLKPTIEKDKVAYQLFSDPKASLIQAIGIGFKTSERTMTFIAKKTSGDVTEVIPAPTVMIVDTSGAILFEYINPNYKVRLSSKLLLANLKALKED